MPYQIGFISHNHLENGKLSPFQMENIWKGEGLFKITIKGDWTSPLSGSALREAAMLYSTNLSAAIFT